MLGKEVKDYPEDEYLDEMRIMKQGITAMMGLFGETQLVIYFKRESHPCHHLHVHA